MALPVAKSLNPCESLPHCNCEWTYHGLPHHRGVARHGDMDWFTYGHRRAKPSKDPDSVAKCKPPHPIVQPPHFHPKSHVHLLYLFSFFLSTKLFLLHFDTTLYYIEAKPLLKPILIVTIDFDWELYTFPVTTLSPHFHMQPVYLYPHFTLLFGHFIFISNFICTCSHIPLIPFHQSSLRFYTAYS